jgi:hypothetical protein
MFKLLNPFYRSGRTNRTTARPESSRPRRAAVEPLEDRQLCSVSSVEPTSFSLGASNPQGISVSLSPIQSPAGNNIIAVLIGL